MKKKYKVSVLVEPIYLEDHSDPHEDNYLWAYRVKIKNNTCIGVNSTLRDNIIVGNHSIIGAGSLISKDADSFSIYKGNPSIKSKVPSNKIKNP